MSEWIKLDAADQSIGRLATQIATLLMGKDQVEYARNRDNGRHIVVVNCAGLKISDRRATEVKYRHSGYLGNLKETKKGEIAPEILLSEAVRGMVPKNKLGVQMLKRLHCFNQEDHPYKGQINE